MRMRAITFGKRVGKEILRDPLTLFFGLGFPLVLLGLFIAIQSNIPVEMFAIERVTPGLTVFGLSFITLFTATIVARDRETAFLTRLYATPMTSLDFLLGYLTPMLPISLTQAAICYLCALLLGLPLRLTILYALLFLLPVALLFISFGLLFGSILNVKQAGGICGALFTNLSAWLSGIWFDLTLVGGWFEGVASALPFVHCVELERRVLAGEWAGIGLHLGVIIAYTVVILTLAVVLFRRQMRHG